MDYAMLKTTALVLFSAAFAGIVLWLALAGSRRFRDAAKLPLEDDDAAPDDGRPSS